MASDFESGTKKIVDVTIKSKEITSDILKSALQDFMNGKAEKKGRMSYRQLENKSDSKLDNIEVSEQNIDDFLNTARKYDVDFALKLDKSTAEPTYHVFFSADKTENFKKAFIEYAGKMQSSTKKRGEISREQIKKEASKVSVESKKKHKEKERSKENVR